MSLCVGDMARYLLKVAKFSYPICI